MSKKRRLSHVKKQRALYAFGGIAIFAITIIVLLGFSKSLLFKERTITTVLPEPFPVSVDPKQRLILEEPFIGSLAQDSEEPEGRLLYIGFLEKAAIKLAQYDWYQSLASPSSRILVIVAGERREQVIDNFGDILNWTDAERATFATRATNNSAALLDGVFYPGHYLVHKNASPEEVALLVTARFEEAILRRYTDSVEEVVPITDAVIVASLLEREAYSFEDMRKISGVIWNRLFIDMPLQLDATLQYARGSLPYEPWWPLVSPGDKFLDSPHNTYQHKGLPPSPIANVRASAVIAALNPVKTDCLFYFHDDDGNFSCTATYEEHVENLTREYGQGR